MNEYKMDEKEKTLLGRWNNARMIHLDSANALEKGISSFVIAKIVPKMGLKNLPNTALPIDINFESGTIKIGIVKIDNPIIVPKGNGEIKIS